jgi:NAD+ synthase (glutamine-hydrolysing)
MTSVPATLARFGYARVATVTPELQLGHPEANAALHLSLLQELDAAEVQLAVFPELSLTGYSCADLFHLSGFLAQAKSALLQLIEQSTALNVISIVGLPWEIEGRLYNMAAVFSAGCLHGLVPKSHLPNNAEFYDRRWFSPAHTLRQTEIMVGAQKVPVGTDLIFRLLQRPEMSFGIEICEDLWTVSPPSSYLAEEGALILANLSASTETLGKAGYRRGLIQQQSGRCVAAYLYAAAGPGESSTDVVYSGHSMIAENGSLLREAERFQFTSQHLIADIDLQKLLHDRGQNSAFRDAPRTRPAARTVQVIQHHPAQGTATPLHRPLPRHPFVPSNSSERSSACEEIFAIQATGLARRLRAVQPATLVLGLSGGLDSTLALLVAQAAIARSGTATQILCVTMPGLGTTSRTKDNALELAKALNCTCQTLSIKDAVIQHLKDIGHPQDQHDITFENAQARERTQVLMDMANKTHGLVLGTGDLSEAALGWCTFNGDHMSMYHINAGIPKTLVRYLISWCASQPSFSTAAPVLLDILDTPISPELLPAGPAGDIAQKTEDHVGPYELVDFFLYHLLRCGCSKEKIAFLAHYAFQGSYTEEQIHHWLERFLHRFQTQQFKRSSMPDGPKVGSVALSPRGDWRMPSDLARLAI